jgi:large-conductance mechanosensitive channel
MEKKLLDWGLMFYALFYMLAIPFGVYLIIKYVKRVSKKQK